MTLTGATSALEGATQRYSFIATDPGSDVLRVFAVSAGSFGSATNILFDPATGQGSFDVTFSDGPALAEVSVQIADSADALSNLATIAVNIQNVAPTISNLQSNHAELLTRSTDRTVTITGAYFDPAQLLDTHVVNVQWGDGTTTQASADQINDTFNAAHTYARGGIYTLPSRSSTAMAPSRLPSKLRPFWKGSGFRTESSPSLAPMAMMRLS